MEHVLRCRKDTTDSPGWQARQSADRLEGLTLHSQLQRCIETLAIAQHLHLHGELVLEMLVSK